MVIGKLLNLFKWKICYQLSWLVHRGRYLNRKGNRKCRICFNCCNFCNLRASSSCLAGLANTGFGLCESVEGWRRGSAGLRPPTPSLHTCNVPLLHAPCTNLYNIAMCYTILRFFYQHVHYVLLVHSAWIVHQAFSTKKKDFCGQCFFYFVSHVAIFFFFRCWIFHIEEYFRA